MDEVHGGKMFWRQLNSRFGYGQIRILGSYLAFFPSLPVVRGTRTTGRDMNLFIFKGVWGRSPICVNKLFFAKITITENALSLAFRTILLTQFDQIGLESLLN